MALFKLIPSRPLDGKTEALLKSIPGVRTWRGHVTAGENCAWIAERMLIGAGYQCRVQAPPSEAKLATLPSNPELVEWLPSFLCPYQTDALLWAIPRSGSHLWHPTGCLSGDTTVIVDRGLGRQRVGLACFVEWFNKQPSRSALIQSMDEATGQLVWNPVVAAIASGVKPVFLLRTVPGGAVQSARRSNVGEIRATADHRFLTPTGWVTLQNLCVPGTHRVIYAAGAYADWRGSFKAIVTSIEELPPEPTYDLTMAAPHNNFVANNFVVHNSGKSIDAIVWALAKPGLAVIVCKAASRRQFANEVRRFCPAIQPFIITGEKALTREQLEEVARSRIAIINWDILTEHVAQLIVLRPTSVVFDETHKAKAHKRVKRVPLDTDRANHAAMLGAVASGTAFDAITKSHAPDQKYKWVELNNVSVSAKKLASAAKRRLGTTASPIEDRLRDLWAQLDLIQPGEHGYFGGWAKRYLNASENKWGGLDTAKRHEEIPKVLVQELTTRLSFCVHAVAQSVTTRDLPPKRRAVIYIPASEQVQESGGFPAEFKRAAKMGGNELIEVRLRQSASRKRRYSVERVMEAVRQGEKVVVFTGRQKDCDLFGDAVKAALAKEQRVKDTPIWVAHGSTSADARDDIRVAYMGCMGPAVLVGTGYAWGESISLQDTDLAIFVMLPYTPGMILQWEGRFVRHGQKRPLLIEYHIAEGTHDEHVADILLSKLPAVENVVGNVGLDGLKLDLATGGKTDEELASSLVAKILAGVVVKETNGELDL